MSKQHVLLKKVLKEMFSNAQIIDEHCVRHEGIAYLVDIFVPRINAAFEIQGRQHEEYVPFFHGNDSGKFGRQLKIDCAKANACVHNGIDLYYIHRSDIITPEFIFSLLERGPDVDNRTTERKS